MKRSFPLPSRYLSSTPCTVLAASALLASAALLLAQGSLTPPGAPAPMMKTLDQIESRTPIGTAPFTISAAGSYYLSGNLTVATGNAIIITSDNVTLDLNGFTISSTAPSPGSGSAVALSSTRKNITVRNGNIRGTTTFTAGAFTLGGFLDGVSGTSSASANLRISDLNILGMASDGINLSTTTIPTLVVERCTVTACGGLGIQAGIINECSADTTGNSAIFGDCVYHCSGETVNTPSTSANGVSGFSIVDSCRGIAVSGQGVQGISVSNSRGTSTSDSGVSGTSVFNCEGISTSGDAGIKATGGTVSFSRARRDGGVAISAANAIGCTVIGSGTVSAISKTLGTP